MSGIKVVVVIVTYKSADLTIECLRSLERERGTEGLCLQVIVVDNASGDTSKIADAVKGNVWSPWVTVIEAPKNGGFAYGNNVAFQHAYGAGPPGYFYLLNPDTLVRNGAISALVKFLEANPQVGIAGSSLETSGGTLWPFAFRFPSIMSELESGLQFWLATLVLRPWVVAMRMSDQPQPVDWVPGASMMLRRAVLDKIGGFDENYFLYFEETDFCFRAKKAGFRTWYVPQSRVMHIAGQSTKVTGRSGNPKRLPAYWFESRRRYFATSGGLSYAMAVDVIALLAHLLGSLKRRIQQRSDRGVPHYIADLARHSLLWSKNRRVLQLRTSRQAPRF